jgi:hypothetical protein
MAMVLYEGRVIAFGRTEDIFSRVRGARVPGPAKMPPQPVMKAPSPAAVAESV